MSSKILIRIILGTIFVSAALFHFQRNSLYYPVLAAEPTPVPDFPPSPAEMDGSSVPIQISPITSPTRLTNTLCSDYSPELAGLLSSLTQEEWLSWVKKLSGAEAVTVNGTSRMISTRYTYAMFSSQETIKNKALAYEYVLEQVHALAPPSVVIEEDLFNNNKWKNLIVTIPGTSFPDEVVILSAHLDNYSPDPYNNAPGAEDNASGAATLLQAFHWMSQAQFQRSVRFIWFTGEEQGLLGSFAYVADHPMDQIIGVINFDMFGYDADADRCFELHVGTLSTSNQIGLCFASTVSTYQIDTQFDYLTSDSRLGCRSDHCPFWNQGVGAVEILENYRVDSSSYGCGGRRDASPYYHTTSDTIDTINPLTGFNIAKAGIATAANLAKMPLSISGTVSVDGIGLAGVNVSAVGSQNYTAITNSSGNYLFEDIAQGDYWLTPTLPCYQFTPVFPSSGGSIPAAVALNNSNIINRNFQGMISPAPLLLSPVGMITPPFDILWKKTAESSEYILSLYRYQNDTFSTFPTSCNTQTCTYSIPELATGRYNMRIRSDGCQNSRFVRFSVLPVYPSRPEGLSVIEQKKPTFTWNAANHAERYQIQIKRSRDNRLLLSRMVSSSQCSGNPSQCRFPSPILFSQGNYSMLVRGSNKSGWGEFAIIPFIIP